MKSLGHHTAIPLGHKTVTAALRCKSTVSSAYSNERSIPIRPIARRSCDLTSFNAGRDLPPHPWFSPLWSLLPSLPFREAKTMRRGGRRRSRSSVVSKSKSSRIRTGRRPGRLPDFRSAQPPMRTWALLVHFPELERLYLIGSMSSPFPDEQEDKPFGDKGLVHLRGLSKLRTLRLDPGDVTARGLANLAGLTSLEHLDLSLMIGDDAFPHLERLTESCSLVSSAESSPTPPI